MQQKFCLCAYNVDTLGYMCAVVQAAEEERAPIILEAGENAIEVMCLKYYAKVARQLAEDASVPVVGPSRSRQIPRFNPGLPG